MKKLLYLIFILLGFIQVAQASYLDRSKRIVDGELAPPTPWAVKLYLFKEPYPMAYAYCTGTLLSPNYVLTARHCVANVSKIHVHYSTGEYNHPSKNYDIVKPDAILRAPKADMALLYISQAHVLNAYPSLDLAYEALAGDKGTIQGYGIHGEDETNFDKDALYQAQVQIKKTIYNPYSYAGDNGEYIAVKRVTGISNQGDSGGPLLVNGKIVGVLHGSHTLYFGGPIYKLYASVKQNKQWIESTVYTKK